MFIQKTEIIHLKVWQCRFENNRQFDIDYLIKAFPCLSTFKLYKTYLKNRLARVVTNTYRNASCYDFIRKDIIK